MGLSKPFAAASEDLHDNKVRHIRGIHVIYVSQKFLKAKGLLLNRFFKPVPIFYREVDLSDFPQDIPRTLRLGGFLNLEPPCPQGQYA